MEDEDLERRAAARAAVTASGIGAALGREITAPDLDGRRWRCVVSDGVHSETIEVSGPRLPHDGAVENATIEETVEDVAGNLVRQDRLRELVSISPLSFPELYLGE